MNKRPMPEDYAPYNACPEFSEGIDDYMNSKYANPYTDPRDGVKAQAWDRGSEYAMRVVRHGQQTSQKWFTRNYLSFHHLLPGLPVALIGRYGVLT